MNLRNNSASSHTIQLVRVIFDDASTTRPETGFTPGGSNTVIGQTDDGVYTPIPEPSRLALLALGAAGVIARRQRRQSED